MIYVCGVAMLHLVKAYTKLKVLKAGIDSVQKPMGSLISNPTLYGPAGL